MRNIKSYYVTCNLRRSKKDIKRSLRLRKSTTSYPEMPVYIRERIFSMMVFLIQLSIEMVRERGIIYIVGEEMFGQIQKFAEFLVIGTVVFV